MSYHRLRGRVNNPNGKRNPNPVLTATGFVIWEMAIFDSHKIQTPWPITKKFGTCDYVCGPYGCAKFGANMSMGASPYLCNRVTDFDDIWHYDAHCHPTADRLLKFPLFL